MELLSTIDIKKLPEPIRYGQQILLIGSCFTEHIGQAMQEHKFQALQNPNGILFDPASVSQSLVSYVENKQYVEADLFYLNELWNSWHHHSRFSHIDKAECLKAINQSQREAHAFLKQADWLIITLGSSFSYLLKEATPEVTNVANCHRAPAQWFQKHLLAIDETISLLDTAYHRIRLFNPGLKIIFTISPVRHLRDGVIDNNRSKARLVEVVHHLVNKFEGLYYFPAYELVIDVLRDYRFYDIDLAHPNYQATDFVLRHFKESCIDPAAYPLMEEVRKITTAKKHKAFQPTTKAHQDFLRTNFEKAKQLQVQFPFLDFKEELAYFSANRE